MFKMIIVVMQSFETVESCEEFYEEIKGELLKHTKLQISGRVVSEFASHTPEPPES